MDYVRVLIHLVILETIFLRRYRPIFAQFLSFLLGGTLGVPNLLYPGLLGKGGTKDDKPFKTRTLLLDLRNYSCIGCDVDTVTIVDKISETEHQRLSNGTSENTNGWWQLLVDMIYLSTYLGMGQNPGT